MTMFEKPLGGTELMFNELVKRVPNVLEKFSIFNYASYADPNKTMIYWNQLSYDQEAIQFLQHKENVDKINHFVFVSNWQAEQFRKMFKIPGHKTKVIQNAHLGVTKKEITKKDKLKICYTSTPWRGLDVLLLAWEILQPQNCELHVFSSCKIYGKDFAQQDSQYEFLYDWCKRLPGVVYRGSIPNEELRKELPDFDVLAYPSTFEETSCIAVIEALATGLRVITSSIGALPETTEGWARMYSYIEDREDHGRLFSKILGEEIQKMFNGELIEHLQLQQNSYHERWSWDSRIKDWEYFLNKISNPEKVESKPTENQFIFRNSWDSQLFDEVYNKNEYGIKELSENDVVLDIGSHIGSFTKLCFDKGSKNVYSYEANYDNFRLSEKNLNNYPYNINNLAVWRSDVNQKEVSFYLDSYETNTGVGTVMVENGVSVDTISLDNILSKFDKVRILKIDVEGSEFPILLTSKLLNKVDEIIGEFHEYETLENLPENCKIDGYSKYTRYDISNYLEQFGFKVEITGVDWSEYCGFFRAIKNN